MRLLALAININDFKKTLFYIFAQSLKPNAAFYFKSFPEDCGLKTVDFFSMHNALCAMHRFSHRYLHQVYYIQRDE